MVLESLLGTLLNRYLAPYVENLDSAQLRISLLSGRVRLQNIAIRESAIASLTDLPLSVIAGTIGSITIDVPLGSLRSKPITATVDSVYVLCGPRPTRRTAAATLVRDAARKATALSALELHYADAARHASMGGPTPPTDAEEAHVIEGLLGTVLANLHVRVTRLHVRYERTVVGSERPYASPSAVPPSLPEAPDRSLVVVGATLAELSLATTDASWTPQFVRGGADRVFKLATLQGLSVYVDSAIAPRGEAVALSQADATPSVRAAWRARVLAPFGAVFETQQALGQISITLSNGTASATSGSNSASASSTATTTFPTSAARNRRSARSGGGADLRTLAESYAYVLNPTSATVRLTAQLGFRADAPKLAMVATVDALDVRFSDQQTAMILGVVEDVHATWEAGVIGSNEHGIRSAGNGIRWRRIFRAFILRHRHTQRVRDRLAFIASTAPLYAQLHLRRLRATEALRMPTLTSRDRATYDEIERDPRLTLDDVLAMRAAAERWARAKLRLPLVDIAARRDVETRLVVLAAERERTDADIRSKSSGAATTRATASVRSDEPSPRVATRGTRRGDERTPASNGVTSAARVSLPYAATPRSATRGDAPQKPSPQARRSKTGFFSSLLRRVASTSPNTAMNSGDGSFAAAGASSADDDTAFELDDLYESLGYEVDSRTGALRQTNADGDDVMAASASSIATMANKGLPSMYVWVSVNAEVRHLSLTLSTFVPYSVAAVGHGSRTPGVPLPLVSRGTLLSLGRAAGSLASLGTTSDITVLRITHTTVGIDARAASIAVALDVGHISVLDCGGSATHTTGRLLGGVRGRGTAALAHRFVLFSASDTSVDEPEVQGRGLVAHERAQPLLDMASVVEVDDDERAITDEVPWLPCAAAPSQTSVPHTLASSSGRGRRTTLTGVGDATTYDVEAGQGGGGRLRCNPTRRGWLSARVVTHPHSVGQPRGKSSQPRERAIPARHQKASSVTAKATRSTVSVATRPTFFPYGGDSDSDDANNDDADDITSISSHDSHILSTQVDDLIARDATRLRIRLLARPLVVVISAAWIRRMSGWLQSVSETTRTSLKIANDSIPRRGLSTLDRITELWRSVRRDRGSVAAGASLALDATLLAERQHADVRVHISAPLVVVPQTSYSGLGETRADFDGADDVAVGTMLVIDCGSIAVGSRYGIVANESDCGSSTYTARATGVRAILVRRAAVDDSVDYDAALHNHRANSGSNAPIVIVQGSAVDDIADGSVAVARWSAESLGVPRVSWFRGSERPLLREDFHLTTELNVPTATTGSSPIASLHCVLNADTLEVSLGSQDVLDLLDIALATAAPLFFTKVATEVGGNGCRDVVPLSRADIPVSRAGIYARVLPPFDCTPTDWLRLPNLDAAIDAAVRGHNDASVAAISPAPDSSTVMSPAAPFIVLDARLESLSLRVSQRGLAATDDAWSFAAARRAAAVIVVLGLSGASAPTIIPFELNVRVGGVHANVTLSTLGSAMSFNTGIEDIEISFGAAGVARTSLVMHLGTRIYSESNSTSETSVTQIDIIRVDVINAAVSLVPLVEGPFRGAPTSLTSAARNELDQFLLAPMSARAAIRYGHAAAAAVPPTQFGVTSRVGPVRATIAPEDIAEIVALARSAHAAIFTMFHDAKQTLLAFIAFRARIMNSGDGTDIEMYDTEVDGGIERDGSGDALIAALFDPEAVDALASFATTLFREDALTLVQSRAQRLTRSAARAAVSTGSEKMALGGKKKLLPYSMRMFVDSALVTLRSAVAVSVLHSTGSVVRGSPLLQLTVSRAIVRAVAGGGIDVAARVGVAFHNPTVQHWESVVDPWPCSLAARLDVAEDSLSLILSSVDTASVTLSSACLAQARLMFSTLERFYDSATVRPVAAEADAAAAALAVTRRADDGDLAFVLANETGMEVLIWRMNRDAVIGELTMKPPQAEDAQVHIYAGARLPLPPAVVTTYLETAVDRAHDLSNFDLQLAPGRVESVVDDAEVPSELRFATGDQGATVDITQAVYARWRRLLEKQGSLDDSDVPPVLVSYINVQIAGEGLFWDGSMCTLSIRSASLTSSSTCRQISCAFCRLHSNCRIAAATGRYKARDIAPTTSTPT